MSNTGRLLSLIAVVACAVALGTPAIGQQSKAQQACINAVNKDAVKVGKAQGKENLACVKDGTKEAVSPTCPGADLKQKVAKKISKAVEDDVDRCTASPPDFAYTSGGTAASAYQQAELDLLADIFGSTDLSATISTDKAVGGCQVTVAKDVERISATAAQEFVKCEKGALGGDAVAVGDVTGCVGVDSNTKVMAATSKLSADINGKCGSVTVSTAFPGACSSAPVAALAGCLGARACCRMCLAANVADALNAPCDSLDDGALNSSCMP